MALYYLKTTPRKLLDHGLRLKEKQSTGGLGPTLTGLCELEQLNSFEGPHFSHLYHRDQGGMNEIIGFK